MAPRGCCISAGEGAMRDAEKRRKAIISSYQKLRAGIWLKVGCN